MANISIKIGQTPWYNVDTISKTMEVCDTVIDGYIDESFSVRRRRGLKLNQDLATGKGGQGLFYWTQVDKLIAVTGGRVYSISASGVANELTGVTLSENNPIVFADGNTVSGSPWLYLADGGYPVYTQGGTLTRLTSASGAPSNCTSIAWSQGRFLAMEAGTRKFYATDVNPSSGDIENDYFLSSDNPLTAEARPDTLEYIGASWEEILVWGKQGMEVWRADDAFFSPIPGAFSPVGLVAKYSVAEADNTVFALCRVDNGSTIAVVRMQGRTPKVVSLAIERILCSYTTIDDAIGFVTSDSHYVLTFPTEGVTWAYDYRGDKWHIWSKWNQTFANREEFLGRHSVTAFGKTFMQSRVDGKLFEFDTATYQDNSEILATEYITGNLTHSTANNKRNHFLQFHIKRGVGGVTDKAYMMLRWKDNNEAAFQIGKQRTIDLGTQGNREAFIKSTLLGMYRSRQYSFLMTDNADLCLKSIEENVQELSK